MKRDDDPDRAYKVGYVADAAQTRRHACHWPGCPVQVPPAMWGCRPHWARLPLNIRDAIWRAFRPGQEITARATVAYVQAAKAAQNWIAKHHGTTPGGTTEARPK